MEHHQSATNYCQRHLCKHNNSEVVERGTGERGGGGGGADFMASQAHKLNALDVGKARY